MKFGNSLQASREETFDIENPEISVMTISCEVTVVESLDGKCHVKILADSKKTEHLVELVEIVATNEKLTVRVDEINRYFWWLGGGGFHGLSVVLQLPKTGALKIKTVSGDIEINQTLASIEIASVSGDVSVLQNPEGNCTVKTVSGDIATHAFSGCQYLLKSISGDIRVHVAPNLEVDVDGSSISGDLNSEISLNTNNESSSDNGKVVTIRTSTKSGDFTLARN